MPVAAAPAARTSPLPAPSTAPSTGPQAFTDAWREPALPAPRRALTPAAAPPTQPETGHAICPACAARNPFDALRCARCAAAIPPPGADAPRALAAPGAAIAIRVAPREPLPDDPLAVLPAQVREQIEASRAASQARSAAAQARDRARARAIASASGVAALLGGLLVSLTLISGWPGLLAAAALDAAIGAAAGWWTFTRGGGIQRGLLTYAAAAFLSAGIKLTLGGIPVGLSAFAAFLVLVPVTWISAVAGGLLGQRIDDWLWDQA